MNILEKLKRIFGKSPVKGSTIMYRAGGYAHKKNIHNVLWIFMLIGIIFGRIISDVTDDVINTIGTMKFIIVLFGGLIGILIGGLIGNYSLVGKFIGGFIGGFSIFFLALNNVMDVPGVPSSLSSGDIIFIIGLIIALIDVLRRFAPYYKWQFDYLGELVVADELYKVGGYQPCRVFHGFKSDGGNIDHIVVCARGVFCVETKMRRKYPIIGGKIIFENNAIHIHEIKTELQDNMITQIENNANELYKKIEEYCRGITDKKLKAVIPVIVFPGWCVKEDSSKTTMVCSHKKIVGLLNKGDGILTNQTEFNKICEFLENATQTDLFGSK